MEKVAVVVATVVGAQIQAGNGSGDNNEDPLRITKPMISYFTVHILPKFTQYLEHSNSRHIT